MVECFHARFLRAPEFRQISGPNYTTFGYIGHRIVVGALDLFADIAYCAVLKRASIGGDWGVKIEPKFCIFHPV